MPRSKNDISAGEWRQTFLAALRGAGIVQLACDAAGIIRKTAYARRKTDSVFAADWEEALDEATDALEAKLRAIALGGDVRALEISLAAIRPHKYGRRRIEATGRDGGPMEFRNVEQMSDDELDAVIALAQAEVIVAEAKAKGKAKKGES